MTEAYDGRQVVRMDLHRRRSVLVRMTEDGRKLETVRIETARPRCGRCWPGRGRTRGWWSRATYCWYWRAVDGAGGRRG